MERLRLTEVEKALLVENFKKEVNNADKLSTINFNPKGLINEIDTKSIKKPVIAIELSVMSKMQALVNESPVEISWHCFVKRNKEKNVYYVYDIAVFPQINTATTTTTDQDKYAEWISEYIMNPDSNFEDMRLHGHSHVNMSVFSSGTDDAYQEDLIRNTKDGDYYIFLILNKKGDICSLLYDFEQQILFKNTDITMKIIDKNGINPTEWAKSMIAEKCETPKPSYGSYQKQYSSYDYGKQENSYSNQKRKGIFKR